MPLDLVAIVDYGMGNLRSVENAIQHLGGNCIVVSDAKALAQFNKIILPGVGAFGPAMDCLHKSGMCAALDERRHAGAHVLGICLGMQLMCRQSEEDGLHSGLGWFSASVKQFDINTELAVPHMGWNSVAFHKADFIVEGLQSCGDAYFVHSYYVSCDDFSDVLATTEYGLNFHSMIQRGNIHGIQFHPEKSQEFGLAIIRNYLKAKC